MSEEFLHYLWLHRLYQTHHFFTTNNEPFEIIHPGLPNSDAGPDFFNAKIKMGSTVWVGNVEIHLKEDDWVKHQHHTDPAYNNVILHVVHTATGTVQTAEKRLVPAWEINYDVALVEKYQSLQANAKWVACADVLPSVSEFDKRLWLDRMVVERLEEKSAQITQMLLMANGDWDQVFFELLCRNFGFGINGLPFEMMARQTPLKLLLKHSANIKQLEALLLGQSGLLIDDCDDAYINMLRQEYVFLAHKYQLKPIDGHLFKFLRTRPSNFPELRLVQLAALLHQSKGLFDATLSALSIASMHQLLTVTASAYWSTHFRSGKSCASSTKKELGKTSRDLLISNTIIPYLFVYFEKRNDTARKEQVLDLLYTLPAERNAIIDHWKQVGFLCRNEAEAQGLLFLKSYYCKPKKCLNCLIGHNALQKL